MQHKMEDKGLSYEKALEDIVKTATKTRKSVNDELGVEGQNVSLQHLQYC